MRIVGILVLILELIGLIITLRGELKKNNITVFRAKLEWLIFKKKIALLLAKWREPKVKSESIILLKRRK